MFGMLGFRGLGADGWVSGNPLFGFGSPYEILDDPLGATSKVAVKFLSLVN